MIILLIATIILVVNWMFEYYKHTRNVYKIPIRIHVNGTRGKSSVTRLIAAGLRAGEIRTVAKTTGTMPRVILPDGREASIERLFGANIIEQKYIFRYAVSLQPQAIVIECMAVNPIYQWITERKFVRSTVSVITNARQDHSDLMGPTAESVAMCLSNTIPKNGIAFTSEEKLLPILRGVAHKRGTKMNRVSPEGISDEELAGFSYIEHADNVALALAVCAHFGVDREVALKGMQESTPDPGALIRYRIEESGKSIHFYNVFAANDPESTLYIWKMITDPLTKEQTKVVILNTRADRYFRSQQLVDILYQERYDYFMLSGERTDQLKLYALDKGIPEEKLVVLGEIDPAEVYNKVLSLTNRESYVIGVGNIAGVRKYGGQIVNYFRKKSKGGV
ncbi:MAG: poly-gamma-glutamate synthase PgsB [Candidatus Cloacimonadia bacterium]